MRELKEAMAALLLKAYLGGITYEERQLLDSIKAWYQKQRTEREN